KRAATPPAPTTPAVPEVAYAGQLAFGWAAALLGLLGGRTRKAALVVFGIDRYKGQPLRGCAADAMRLCDRFQETHGDAGLALPMLNELATVPNLTLSLEAAAAAVKPGGVLWVIYDGHGVSAPSASEPGGRREGLLLADEVLSDRALARML